MRCPHDIAEILELILQRGLLEIRAAGWSGDAERCAVLADHLHNLPTLLSDFSAERMLDYWEMERADLLAQSSGDLAGIFQAKWDQLCPHIDRLRQTVNAT